ERVELEVGTANGRGGAELGGGCARRRELRRGHPALRAGLAVALASLAPGGLPRPGRLECPARGGGTGAPPRLAAPLPPPPRPLPPPLGAHAAPPLAATPPRLCARPRRARHRPGPPTPRGRGSRPGPRVPARGGAPTAPGTSSPRRGTPRSRR